MKIDLGNGKLELIIVMVICAIAVTMLAIVEFNRSLEVIEAENKCVAELIQLSVNRKDIITKDGECYVIN